MAAPRTQGVGGKCSLRAKRSGVQGPSDPDSCAGGQAAPPTVSSKCRPRGGVFPHVVSSVVFKVPETTARLSVCWARMFMLIRSRHVAALVLTAEKSKQSTSVLHARFGSGPSSAPPPSHGERLVSSVVCPAPRRRGSTQQLSLSCRSRRRQERYTAACPVSSLWIWSHKLFCLFTRNKLLKE